MIVFVMIAVSAITLIQAQSATVIHVDTSHVTHTTEKEFVSISFSSELFGDPGRWKEFDITNVRLQNLMRGLVPCIFRLGGSPSDWTQFHTNFSVLNNVDLQLPSRIQVMSEKDWRNLISIVSKTGMRMLVNLNLQQRLGAQWDPTNALDLLKYSQKLNVKYLDVQLGNEPNAYSHHNGFVAIDPDQIARDFIILRKVMQQYPFKSRVVGPDVIGVGTAGKKILNRVAAVAGKALDAITFHQYYFRGDIAKVADYLNPKHFANLAGTINAAKQAVESTPNPDVPLWITETADAWHRGTPNVSDRFVSGFLWLEKLGLAARMGINVVMRQSLWGADYSLISNDTQPNPDYWLSLLHKRLVGQKVLVVSADDNKPVTTRVYAQCTNINSMNTPYHGGSVTVFGLNMSPNLTSIVTVSAGSLVDQAMDVYLMSPGDSRGMLSPYVNVNGKRLTMIDDDLPKVIEPLHSHSSKGITLPPLTFGFFVFPKANATVCK